MLFSLKELIKDGEVSVIHLLWSVERQERHCHYVCG